MRGFAGVELDDRSIDLEFIQIDRRDAVLLCDEIGQLGLVEQAARPVDLSNRPHERGAGGSLCGQLCRQACGAALEPGKSIHEARTEPNAAADLSERYGEECRRVYGRLLVSRGLMLPKRHC